MYLTEVDGPPGDRPAVTVGGPDHLAGPHLLVTACFDGPLDTYLDELCDELAAEANEIWGRCTGAPQPPAGAPLKAYLRAHHQKTGWPVFRLAPRNDQEGAAVSKILIGLWRDALFAIIDVLRSALPTELSEVCELSDR